MDNGYVQYGRRICRAGSCHLETNRYRRIFGAKRSHKRGCVFTIYNLLRRLNRNIEEQTVAIQGFGNVGYNAAQIIHNDGAKVIAVSDSKGGIYNPGGLDPYVLLNYKKEHGSFKGFPDGDEITNNELLELKCNILIPAALGNQITKHNADKIQAEIIAEGANGPTTTEADAILFERGVYHIPDILANAGGVTVSYYEWVQGLERDFWCEDEVNRKLKNIMDIAFDCVWDISQNEKVHMRMGAYLLAVSRVAKAKLWRGLYP